MKKILPLLIIFALFVTACGGNKEAEKKEEKKDDGKILQDDGMLNFKNALEKDGAVAYLLSNNSADKSGKLQPDSRVEGIIVNENGKITVYNTGYHYEKSIKLNQLDDLSEDIVKENGVNGDKAIIEKKIQEARAVYKINYENINTNDNKSDDAVIKRYESAVNLKYRAPEPKDLIYKMKDQGEEKAIFINALPNDVEEVGYKDDENISVLKIVDGKDNGFTLTEPTDLISTGKKQYIGYKTKANENNSDFRAIAVEAPKGTKGITSGLDQ
ncbi:hypothetical protein [Macrococcus carouselicus]|uniref:Lipoprotein n=1 Tax=Macrococcus carouselicus TaxID=69969 RepID=A0A9Q8FNT8_9STAP|nr:hypothetical protein [Macrococcus carouselicus]TDL95530.1 hypothetical protein ERX40_10125 [Macrococcus carouselicus]